MKDWTPTQRVVWVILDYGFAMVQALAILGVCHAFEIKWWIAAPFVTIQIGLWFRKDLRR